MQTVFSLLSNLVSIYTTLCIIRVLLSWGPNILRTSLGQVICALTDPYLNLFRKIRWLRISYIDFSPVFALSILYILATVFSGIAYSKTITLGAILIIIIRMIESAIHTVFIFFEIVYLIRIVVNFAGKDYSTFAMTIDRLLKPVTAKLTAFIARGRIMKYRSSLIIAFIIILAVDLALRYGFSFLYVLLLNSKI